MPILGDLEDDLVGRLLSVEGSDRSGFSYFDGIGIGHSLHEELLHTIAKLHDAGLVEFDSPIEVSSFEEANLRLTQSGRMHALFNEGRILRTVMAGTSESILDVSAAFFRLREGLQIVDSSAWTGLTHRLGSQKITRIRENVYSLTLAIEQADMSERDRDNALRRARAIYELVNAPDTPWRVVLELLNSKPLTAFLNAAAIIALITSVF